MTFSVFKLPLPSPHWCIEITLRGVDLRPIFITANRSCSLCYVWYYKSYFLHGINWSRRMAANVNQRQTGGAMIYCLIIPRNFFLKILDGIPWESSTWSPFGKYLMNVYVIYHQEGRCEFIWLQCKINIAGCKNSEHFFKPPKCHLCILNYLSASWNNFFICHTDTLLFLNAASLFTHFTFQSFLSYIR